MGCEFCLGGRRGGSKGFGFAVGLAVADDPPLPSPRTGGLGRPAVDKPVVLARYGTGGGAGFWTACAALWSSTCACISSAGKDAPNLLRSGVTAWDATAPP